MITIRQANEFALLRLADIAPIMKTHLQRDLDSGCAVGRIKAMAKLMISFCAEPLGKLDHRFMGKARENHMLQPIKLIFDRSINARISMPKQIHPPRTHGIQIAFAIEIVKPHPLTTLNRNQRQLLVRLHLRARMPHGVEAAA